MAHGEIEFELSVDGQRRVISQSPEEAQNLALDIIEKIVSMNPGVTDLHLQQIVDTVAFTLNSLRPEHLEGQIDSISGDDLKNVRWHLGDTVQEMAKRLMVSRRTITNWESQGVPQNRLPQITRLIGHHILEVRRSRDKASLSPNHDDPEGISGEELKAVRYLLSMTGREAADMLKVSPRTIVNWERDGVPSHKIPFVTLVLGESIEKVRRFKYPDGTIDLRYIEPEGDQITQEESV